MLLLVPTSSWARPLLDPTGGFRQRGWVGGAPGPVPPARPRVPAPPSPGPRSRSPLPSPPAPRPAQSGPLSARGAAPSSAPHAPPARPPHLPALGKELHNPLENGPFFLFLFFFSLLCRTLGPAGAASAPPVPGPRSPFRGARGNGVESVS